MAWEEYMEEVYETSWGEMQGLIGNAGQESIMAEVEGGWFDTVEFALHDGFEDKDDFDAFWSEQLGDDKYQAVSEILDAGYDALPGGGGFLGDFQDSGAQAALIAASKVMSFVRWASVFA